MKSDAERLLEMLNDGQWHTRRELLQQDYANHGPGMTVHSRASDLRAKGYEIECRHAGGREWKYRLIVHSTRLFEPAEVAA